MKYCTCIQKDAAKSKKLVLSSKLITVHAVAACFAGASMMFRHLPNIFCFCYAHHPEVSATWSTTISVVMTISVDLTRYWMKLAVLDGKTSLEQCRRP